MLYSVTHAGDLYLLSGPSESVCSSLHDVTVNTSLMQHTPPPNTPTHARGRLTLSYLLCKKLSPKLSSLKNKRTQNQTQQC